MTATNKHLIAVCVFVNHENYIWDGVAQSFFSPEKEIEKMKNIDTEIKTTSRVAAGNSLSI